MKYIFLLVVLGMNTCLMKPVVAQTHPEEKRRQYQKKKNQEVQRNRKKKFQEKRKKSLQQYDIDKDGVLSDDERAMMHEAKRLHRAQMDARLKEAKIRLMKPFDTDGDGNFSKEERQKAKAFIRERMQQMRADFVKTYDANGDGKLSREEKRIAHRERKREMMASYDKNQDGVLSVEERNQAFDAMLEQDPYRLMMHVMGKHKKRKHRQKTPRD